MLCSRQYCSKLNSEIVRGSRLPWNDLSTFDEVQRGEITGQKASPGPIPGIPVWESSSGGTRAPVA